MAPQNKNQPPPPKPKPKAGTFNSGFETGDPAVRTSSGLTLAAVAPQQKGKPMPRRPLPGKKGKPGPPQVMTTYQKQQLGSGFVDSRKDQERKTVIGSNPALFADGDAEETNSTVTYDGLKPPDQVTSRDSWRAVQAPLQSKPGRRERGLYEQILKQFAVSTNPRYLADAPERDRSHIFVWDVSLAMNCEIPHFSGAKEHTLGQTCDWVRHEGPMRGWLRVSDGELFNTIERGQLVVVMPKDTRLKGIAIVPPQPRAFVPVVVSAGKKRGWGLTLRDAIGVTNCEYFTHV